MSRAMSAPPFERSASVRNMRLHASILLAILLSTPACNHADTPDATSAFSEIDALTKKREWPEVVTRLEEMRAQRGADPQVLLRLANAYNAKDQPEKAIARLREGLDAHPDAAFLYVPLAQLYIRLSQHPSARQVLEQARAHGVGDKQISIALGTCLGQMGDLEGAAREFDRALAAGDDERVVRFNQAVLLTQKKDHKGASELLEGILAKDPAYAPAKRELARNLIQLAPKDRATVDRALGLCWDAKESLRDDWYLYEVMGDAWMLAGDFDAALESYTEALRLGRNPKSVEDRYRVAKQQQMDRAKAKQQEAAPTTPSEAGTEPH
jgi:tetratricopeptide (TPR) repeat protein